MFDSRPPKHEEFELPADICQAFDAYPKLAPSVNFDRVFWARLEEKRRQYRGFGGLLRRVKELEIEGVAVWRLAASTLSGGLLCLALMSLSLESGSPQPGRSPSPLPKSETGTTYAFYRRDWDIDLLTPELWPPSRPQPKTKPLNKPLKTGGFSCRDLNASLS